MPTTRQQEAGAWLSIFARGLGVSIGTGGFIFELGFDHLSHPIIIPSLVILLGLGPLVEPVWKQVLVYMLKTNRVDLQLTPWFKLQITPPTNGRPPPVPQVTVAVEELVVPPDDETSPITPSLEEPRSQSSLAGDTLEKHSRHAPGPRSSRESSSSSTTPPADQS